jgi:hypothetical protein
MGSITINFANKIQNSVQTGDTAYYTNDLNGESIVQIGAITALSGTAITVEIPNEVVRPTSSSFILFSKTNAANTGSLKGYYLETKLENDSTNKSELFSVGTEVFESSK